MCIIRPNTERKITNRQKNTCNKCEPESCMHKENKLRFVFTHRFPDLLNETMFFIESSTFLKFFDGIPELFSLDWISFKISLDIVRHTFRKFRNGTSTDTIHIYQSFVIELIDERKRIPEEVTNFEFEFIMIFFRETLSYLLDLVLRSINIIINRRIGKPTIVLTVALLEPEKSGESVHIFIVDKRIFYQ